MSDPNIAHELADLSPEEHTFYGFATFLEGRTNGSGWSDGEYKRHKTIGHARSAIGNSNSRGYTRRLYEWSPSTKTWVEIPWVRPTT